MHINTAALADVIRSATAELGRLDAAEGEIGRLAKHRVLLRIEPDREDWAGRELPLPLGAEGIVSDGAGAVEADAARLAGVLAEPEGAPALAARPRAEAGRRWQTWWADNSCWIDADGVRIDLAPLRFGDDDKSAAIVRLARKISALAETEPGGADGIGSPFNACCYRDACRELLAALELILENPDHELLPTERQTAEAAIAKATGEG
jgi:hypothetical protein